MASYTAGTTFVSKNNAEKKWLLINAEGLALGRLASRIAMILRGKHKPGFTPFSDCGDSVIVINSLKVKITGKKVDKEVFYWHTGYPGGIKQRTWKEILESNYPERLMHRAVERMMPKDSPLSRQQMKSLYVYSGDTHAHQGQCPVEASICF